MLLSNMIETGDAKKMDKELTPAEALTLIEVHDDTVFVHYPDMVITGTFLSYNAVVNKIKEANHIVLKDSGMHKNYIEIDIEDDAYYYMFIPTSGLISDSRKRMEGIQNE